MRLTAKENTWAQLATILGCTLVASCSAGKRPDCDELSPLECDERPDECRTLEGWPIDIERQCIGAIESVGCRPRSRGCGLGATIGRAPSGALWSFSDTCQPTGWTETTVAHQGRDYHSNPWSPSCAAAAGDASLGDETTCDGLHAAVAEADRTIVEATSRGCYADSNCVLSDYRGGCLGGCYVALLGVSLDAYRKGQAETVLPLCSAEERRGCPLPPPPDCEDVVAVCREHRCMTAARTAPDAGTL